MKISISTITDTLFVAFISFLLFFILLGTILPRPYSIISSVFLSIIFAVLAFNLLMKKRQKISGKKVEQKAYEDAILQLNLMPKNELIEFFIKTLEQQGYQCERKNGGIFIENKNAILYFKFGFEQVSKADIVRIFNLKPSNSKAYILSENFIEEIITFSLRFENLEVVNAKSLFFYLKEKNCLPENKRILTQTRVRGLKALKSIIDRKKAKTFALYGILFLFLSYFVLLKIYYIICSFVFFTLSLICLLFGEKKPKIN